MSSESQYVYGSAPREGLLGLGGNFKRCGLVGSLGGVPRRGL
jgi:hypothetical protein